MAGLRRQVQGRRTSAEGPRAWPLACKFLDYLEANGEEYWRPPTFELGAAPARRNHRGRGVRGRRRRSGRGAGRGSVRSRLRRHGVPRQHGRRHRQPTGRFRPAVGRRADGRIPAAGLAAVLHQQRGSAVAAGGQLRAGRRAEGRRVPRDHFPLDPAGGGPSGSAAGAAGRRQRLSVAHALRRSRFDGRVRPPPLDQGIDPGTRHRDQRRRVRRDPHAGGRRVRRRARPAGGHGSLGTGRGRGPLRRPFSPAFCRATGR